MRAGDRGKAGRDFAVNAMRYVQAVLQPGASADDLLARPPQALAPRWDDIAFVQAIKCAPCRARSEPYSEMFTLCPPTYLADEVEILRPRAILLLGRSRVRDVVRPLFRDRFDLAWGRHPPGLEVDSLTIGGTPATLLCVNHPSARPADVRRSLESLASL